jgi:hypothetical protein
MKQTAVSRKGEKSMAVTRAYTCNEWVRQCPIHTTMEVSKDNVDSND